jgi:hypothetical protein
MRNKLYNYIFSLLAFILFISIGRTQQPTMVITAAEGLDGFSSKDATLSLTFTPSEVTDNFTEDDITVKNGVISDFSAPSRSHLSFDGVDDYVEVGDVTFLNGLNNFTLSAWVKFDAIPSASERAMILSKDNSFEWFFHGQSINLRLNNGGYDATSYTFSTDTWYYLTTVLNSNGKNYYINGRLVSTAGSQLLLNDTGHPLTMGGRSAAHSIKVGFLLLKPVFRLYNSFYHLNLKL